MALANELRANLEIAFPGAATLFSDVDSPIALAFLRRFPSVTQAAWLTEARLAAFLRRMGYPGRKAAAELLGRLADAPAGLTGPEGNHGEDVKDYWWYLDSTPTHSWMTWRYHYPQRRRGSLA